MAGQFGILNDGGALSERIASFYKNKTIQRSYNFLVYFNESNIPFLEELKSYHAISVELPNYEFKKEDSVIGPFVKSFPILSHNGFEFTIRFEEDADGAISKLIRNLVRRNIDEQGYHRSFAETMIPNIVVSIFQPNAAPVRKVYFKNCYYMKASTANFVYEDGKQIFYDITFNADHFIEEDGMGALKEDHSGK